MTLAIVIYREHAKRRLQRNIGVAVARFTAIRFAPVVVCYFWHTDFAARAKVRAFNGGCNYAVHVSSSFWYFHKFLTLPNSAIRAASIIPSWGFEHLGDASQLSAGHSCLARASAAGLVSPFAHPGNMTFCHACGVIRW